MNRTRISPIPTRFDGHHFRSRLEARWAVFFKHAGIKYVYEPEGYSFRGYNYLPDFYLPGDRMCRDRSRNRGSTNGAMSVYMAIRSVHIWRQPKRRSLGSESRGIRGLHSRQVRQIRIRRVMTNNCSAELAGLGGCQAPISWVVKGADRKMYSCGRHLNRVCFQMATMGLEYMTVGITK